MSNKFKANYNAADIYYDESIKSKNDIDVILKKNKVSIPGRGRIRWWELKVLYPQKNAIDNFQKEIEKNSNAKQERLRGKTEEDNERFLEKMKSFTKELGVYSEENYPTKSDMTAIKHMYYGKSRSEEPGSRSGPKKNKSIGLTNENNVPIEKIIENKFIVDKTLSVSNFDKKSEYKRKLKEFREFKEYLAMTEDEAS